MATLQEIRARLTAADNKNNNNGSNSDSSVYPHWNLAEGQSCVLRFLPDANAKNDYFWVERAMIRLPFNGIKNGENRIVNVQVPCMEMWQGETCPILTEVRPWFKDPTLEEMGRKYWKKRSYIYQGFVRSSQLTEDRIPENPIRRFLIGPQIHNIIIAMLKDPELENLPTDYEHGLDFRVNKISKGGNADYNTSLFARRETALSEEELAAIDKYGLFDLSTFLPKKPGEVELKVIREMFEASVDGKPFDLERWGQYYRPSGMQVNKPEAEDATAMQSAPEPKARVETPVAPTRASVTVDEEPEVKEQAAPATAPTSKKAEDILALIRAKQNKAA